MAAEAEVADDQSIEEVLMRCPPYFCYLLQSQKPRSQRTYVGFTVNPPRRLRQHNGEITAGAWKTKQGRPWDMQCFVSGFPNKTVALQFEWQWQHPLESRVVRDYLDPAMPKSRNLKHRAFVLKALLSCPLWQQLRLTVVPLNSAMARQLRDLLLPGGCTTGTTNLNTVADKLCRRRTAVMISSLPPLTCVCCICNVSLRTAQVWRCNGCACVMHVICLAKHSNSVQQRILPVEGRCAMCAATYPWCKVVAQVQLLSGGPDSTAADEEDNDDHDDHDNEDEDGVSDERQNESAVEEDDDVDDCVIDDEYSEHQYIADTRATRTRIESGLTYEDIIDLTQT